MKGASASKETAESMNYKQIFGARKTKHLPAYAGKPEVAVQVVLDYCELYPDGKETSTKARGILKLAQYSHSLGTMVSTSEFSQRPQWDLELFTNQMWNLRKWSAEKCRTEFRKMLEDPATRGDNGGPPEAPARIRVPAWMTGTDFAEARNTLFETKEVKKQSKAGQANQETLDMWHSESQQGFSRLHAEAMPDVHRPLAKGALTGDGKAVETGLQLMTRIAGDTGMIAIEDGALHAPDAAAAASTAAGKAGAHEFADLGIIRNRSAAAISKDIKAVSGRLETVLHASLPTLQDGVTTLGKEDMFYISAKERAHVTQVWFGYDLRWDEVDLSTFAAQSMDDWPRQQFKPAAEEVTAAGSEEKATAAAHTASFQQALAGLALKPVENVEAMIAKTACWQIADQMQSAETLDSIQFLQSSWESQKVLIQQLASSLRTAKADLARQIKATQTRKQKQEADEKKAAEQKARDEDAEVAEKNRKLLKAAREFVIMQVDLHSLGNPHIRAVDNEKQFEILYKQKKADIFENPLLVRESEAVTSALETAGRLKECLDRWAGSFQQTKDAKRCDKTMAPATETHGVEALTKLFETLAPGAAVIDKPSLPSLEQAISRTWFYGYMPSMACCDWEPDFLGSIRIQISGNTHVLMVSAADAEKILPHQSDAVKSAQRPWIEQMREMLKAATAEQAKQWSEQNVRFFSGALDGQAILITPPGWLVLSKVCSESPVWGLRRSFLSKCSGTERNLAQLAAAKAADQCQDYLDCISLDRELQKA